MRFALSTGAVATLSAVVGAIVAPGAPATTSAIAGSPDGAVTTSAVARPSAASSLTVNRPVTYVQLQPGETPPPGAKVIDAAAPKPITIVTTVPAPAPAVRGAAPVVRTTQSGKPLP